MPACPLPRTPPRQNTEQLSASGRGRALAHPHLAPCPRRQEAPSELAASCDSWPEPGSSLSHLTSGCLLPPPGNPTCPSPGQPQSPCCPLGVGAGRGSPGAAWGLWSPRALPRSLRLWLRAKEVEGGSSPLPQDLQGSLLLLFTEWGHFRYPRELMLPVSKAMPSQRPCFLSQPSRTWGGDEPCLNPAGALAPTQRCPVAAVAPPCIFQPPLGRPLICSKCVPNRCSRVALRAGSLGPAAGPGSVRAP